MTSYIEGQIKTLPKNSMNLNHNCQNTQLKILDIDNDCHSDLL